MAKALPEEVVLAVSELISEISGFEDRSEPFKHILKYFTTKLKKSGTMYFSNKRDINQIVDGMCEKYCFHGFSQQAAALKVAYKIYVPEVLPKTETTNRLNMVKFLLGMSQSPTKYFLEHPDMLQHHESVVPEEEVDWALYLNEGIETWKPDYNSPSSDEFCSSSDEFESKETLLNSLDFTSPTQIRSCEKICVMDLKVNREELMAVVQQPWYNEDNFFMKPESNYREANIGILWEEYLKNKVYGLINLKRSSVISEYKVVREILWQLWCPHISSTFELTQNYLKPRPDVTLASVRSYAFYSFLNELIPHIELLDYFRKFNSYHNLTTICGTHYSYCKGIRTIIDPIYKSLYELEYQVREQEQTYTLLRLSSELNELFQPLNKLKEIHESVILDSDSNSTLKCATHLIACLHESLNFTENKKEQDMKIALFLESVYHYVGMVDSWLIKDNFADYTEEFVIRKDLRHENWDSLFLLQEELDGSYAKNSFLVIFIETVLKIGKNISFLRMLGKNDIIGGTQESIYDEFIRRVFGKLESFCNDKLEGVETQSLQSNFSKEDIRNLNELENIQDVDNGLLMLAFKDFFIEKTQEEKSPKISLYERLSALNTNIIPKKNFFEDVLVNILEERFTISGLMAKNLLIEEHLLEKQFEFLKHLYLFWNDTIFPFYRRLFEKTESTKKNWANDIWLTSHLQDIFMDAYPDFYEKCSVQVGDGWSLCTDSLSVCSIVGVHYDVPWPLNNIIKQEQIEKYRDVFQFLLKLKWALHTVNHLVFSDLELKHSKTTKKPKQSREMDYRSKVTARLSHLKFCVINILNSLQHHVFGSVFGKNVLKFELDFEKASDLYSLVESHSDFINSVWATVMELRTLMWEKDENYNVVNCVRLLKRMWSNLKYATRDNISDCTKMYEKFYSDITPVIFPVCIYDY